MRIEIPDEKSQIKKLKKRIRAIKKALADSKVKEITNQVHYGVLYEQMGIKDI